MKTLQLAFAVAITASIASAQSTVVVKGQKVVLKPGQILPQAPQSSLIPTLPGAPLVGGSDSCTTPDVIVGSGPFAFDNTLATTGVEGQNEALCNIAAVAGISEDVWFTWTATSSGPIVVSMCGMTTIDSKLAIYPGAGCPTPGSALACDDDFCAAFSAPSQVTFNATAGSMYTIQLGDWPTGLPGTGSFTIGVVPPPPPPPANDNCATPQVLTGPGTYSFDLTLATQSPQGQTTASCGPGVAFYKDVWFTYPATTNGTAHVTTCGFVTPGSPTYDTKIEVFAGAGCPSGAAIVCSDDNCTVQALASDLTFSTVCGQLYTIQLGQYAATASITGSIDISESGVQCGPTGVPFCFGDGTGTACPCGNAGAAGNGCASSVNAAGAHLTSSGIPSIANDTLVLTGSGMPSSSALYFQGTAQTAGGAGTVFGDGLRCAGGTVSRLGTKTNVGGSSSFPSGTDPLIHVKGADSAGNVRDYQCWYRNAAAFCTPSTFNLTNGLQLTWAP